MIFDMLIVEDERETGEDLWIAYMIVVKFTFWVDIDMIEPNIDRYCAGSDSEWCKPGSGGSLEKCLEAKSN